MRTIETSLFLFDELNETAKENARDWWRQGYEFKFEAECVIDDAKQIAKLFGLSIDSIYYSGFWHQGSGASYTGDYQYQKGGLKAVKQHAPNDSELHDIVKRLQKLQSDNFYALRARINTTRHNNLYFDFEDTRANNGYMQEAAQNELDEILNNFAHWIYKLLENAYEWAMTEENVDENIRINEYEFTEEGEIV